MPANTAFTASDLTEAVIKRFVSGFAQASPSECWEWSGPKTPRSGYGRVPQYANGRKVYLLAHRVAVVLSGREIPDGSSRVSHSCDSLSCVNPNHLEVTPRRRKVAGELNPGVKLTASQVKRIRRRYAEGGTTQKRLAADYGVSRTQIGRIVNGQKWRSLA